MSRYEFSGNCSKEGFAGAVLMAGCWMVFNKRGGIVLIHAGVGLMMFSEVLVGTSHVETQLQIIEGHTTNYAIDIREVELAIVDDSGSESESGATVSQMASRAGRHEDLR